MKISCLIIDDEPLAINVIKKHIEEVENINIIEKEIYHVLDKLFL